MLEPLPAAEPVPPPAESATAAADWGFDEMIVEPGWPMPGEIAGSWPGGAPVAEPPVAAPPVAEPAVQDVTDAVTGEWVMPDPHPAPAPYAEPASQPVAEEAFPEAPEAEVEPGPVMEAWVPGVSEVEPVVLPEPQAIDPVDETPVDALPVVDPEEPEPALVWADPAPAVEPEPVEDEVAGPPAWQPDADVVPAEEAVEEAPLPVWEPEPVAVEPVAVEPVAVEPVAVVDPVQDVAPATLADDPWQPLAAPAVTVAEADAGAQADEVAEGLALAVAALTPVLARGDTLGVTPRMAAVLRALADEPRGLPDLGRALGVSRPVVADVCARLQDLDLVWRERDPDDRRRMLVIPTAKGLRLAEEDVPRLDRDAVAGALDRLSPAERAALVSAVRVLQEAGAAS